MLQRHGILGKAFDHALRGPFYDPHFYPALTSSGLSASAYIVFIPASQV